MNQVQPGFERETVLLRVGEIIPLKALRPTVKQSFKYRQIGISIASTGLIEPLVVLRGEAGAYWLLDGHLRLEALKDAGIEEVRCLVALKDDTYSYNKRISRLTTAQEHRMVLRALEKGVPVERIASTLGLDVTAIHRRARLLKGITPEVARALADQPVSMSVFDVLRQMAPYRQIQAVDLMAGQGNFSRALAQALLAATEDRDLVRPRGKLRTRTHSREQTNQMERELSTVQRQIKTIEESFGLDALQLTVAKGYLTRLLASPRAVGWLAEKRPEYLTEFRAIAGMTDLGKRARGASARPSTRL